MIRFLVLILSMLTIWSDAQSVRMCWDGKPDFLGACPEKPGTKPFPDDPPRFSNEPELVRIPGGCFQMGSPASEPDRRDNERQHKVCVKGFEIGKYEVTQAQWHAVMGNNLSDHKNCSDCPVEVVSWNDVQEYLGKLNRRTGKAYRLPTEAEWEYACRGGKAGERYCGGDDPDRVAWYNGNSGDQTHPVGRKEANGYGLYDMSGNVREWTCSEYHENYDGAELECTKNKTPGPLAVRGGDWDDEPDSVRSAPRFRDDPTFRSTAQGFRLARSL